MMGEIGRGGGDRTSFHDDGRGLLPVECVCVCVCVSQGPRTGGHQVFSPLSSEQKQPWSEHHMAHVCVCDDVTSPLSQADVCECVIKHHGCGRRDKVSHAFYILKRYDVSCSLRGQQATKMAERTKNATQKVPEPERA